MDPIHICMSPFIILRLNLPTQSSFVGTISCNLRRSARLTQFYLLIEENVIRLFHKYNRLQRLLLNRLLQEIGEER